MKLWKRNTVVAAIVLFVCVAVYLNWSYQGDEGTADVDKTLGQAEMVDANTDPLLETVASPAPTETPEETKASGYFDSARLNREQARDSALTLLQQSIGDEEVDAVMQTEWAEAVQTLATFTVTEAQIENLITAKGYTDCIAFIGDSSISVVVSATPEGLMDDDVAKITEIVTSETGYTASQIKIIEAE